VRSVLAALKMWVLDLDVVPQQEGSPIVEERRRDLVSHRRIRYVHLDRDLLFCWHVKPRFAIVVQWIVPDPSSTLFGSPSTYAVTNSILRHTHNYPSPEAKLSAILQLSIHLITGYFDHDIAGSL